MRVRPLLATGLDLLASLNESTAPQEGNNAIRATLIAEGLWPLEAEDVKAVEAAGDDKHELRKVAANIRARNRKAK
jgi:hypothetical protein